MKEEELEDSKIEWQRPSIVVLEISLTQFNCLKLGDFNDLEDTNCTRS